MRAFITAVAFCIASVSAQNFTAVDSSNATGPWTVDLMNLGDIPGPYLYCNLTGADADVRNVSVIFIADGLQNGNFTVRMYTPGCLFGNTCDQRGIVNVTGSYVIQAAPGIPETTQISQTNDYDKYDQIYQGPVDASSGDFRPTVRLAPASDSSTYYVAQEVSFILLNR